VLLQYPPEKAASNSVAITRGDLDRLEPFEFLNDNLVDFYLKFMAREKRVVDNDNADEDGDENEEGVKASAGSGGGGGEGCGVDESQLELEALEQSHIFTAHFYKKLTGKIDSALLGGSGGGGGEGGKSGARRRSASESDEEEDGDYDDDYGDGDDGSGGAEKADREAAAHAMVARWTKDVDIFSKK
jgi:hypothetical protein